MHLHHDLRALVQKHTGPGGQCVRRMAGHPGCDPRRLAEPVDRTGGVEVDRQVRPAEARPALAAVCGVQPRRRCRLCARGLVEDHVVDAAGPLRADQRGGDVGALLEFRVEQEAVVVVDAAPGGVGRIRLRRREGDRSPRPAEAGRTRRLGVPVARTTFGRAGRRPGGERRQLTGGQTPDVASDERCRVGAGHPRRHQPGLRQAHDAGGVRAGLCSRRQRERGNAADPVARGALGVEDRRDVTVVRRCRGRRRAARVGDQRGHGGRGQDGEQCNVPHLKAL